MPTCTPASGVPFASFTTPDTVRNVTAAAGGANPTATNSMTASIPLVRCTPADRGLGPSPRSWAAWTGAVAAVGLGVALLTWTLRASSNDPGDGHAYAGMGAVMFLLLGSRFSVALIHSPLHARRAPRHVVPRSVWRRSVAVLERDEVDRPHLAGLTSGRRKPKGNTIAGPDLARDLPEPLR